MSAPSTTLSLSLFLHRLTVLVCTFLIPLILTRLAFGTPQPIGLQVMSMALIGGVVYIGVVGNGLRIQWQRNLILLGTAAAAGLFVALAMG